MNPRIDPPEAAELLRWASHNGFTTHIVGDVNGPDALVLVKFRPGYLDVAHLRGADRTEVARIPHDERADIWQPEAVTFHYYGGVLDALKQLQCLPGPSEVDAPHQRYEPPRAHTPTPLTVTATERNKLTIRPPARRENGKEECQ